MKNGIEVSRYLGENLELGGKVYVSKYLRVYVKISFVNVIPEIAPMA